MATKDIKFWRGRQADYDKLTPQDNIIYFILDEFKIYLGGVEVSNNKEYFIGTLMSRFNNIIDIFTWDRSDPIEPPKPTYDTDKTYMTFTATDNQTIDLSSYMDGITNVNWGDGAVDTNTSHTYTTAGDYDVIITHTENSSFGWRDCIFLKEVKSIGKLNKTDFSYCFFYCASLTSIQSGLFENNVNVTIFDYCFSGCSSLTSIPAGLFDKNINATSFEYCFNDCTSLTQIPVGLFDKNVNVTIFGFCFAHCSSLTQIPVGLFDKNINVENFSYCFMDCSNLNQPYNCTSPSLPKLWERNGTNGAVKVTNYGEFATNTPDTFNESIPVTWGGMMIPEDVTTSEIVITTEANETISLSFYVSDIYQVDWGDGDVDNYTDHRYMRAGNYNIIITHTEDSSFKWSQSYYLKEVKSIGKLKQTDFSYCFSGCRLLTSIPAGIFDKYVNATNFSWCFGGCESLTSIPEGLFDKNVNVEDFDYCFRSCDKLNQPYNCTSPGLPKLWERNGSNGAVAVTSYSNFASNAHATFKESVPVEWGGTMTQTRTVKPIVLAAITPTPNDVEFNNTNSTIFTIGVKDNETIECGGPNTMYIDWGDGVVDGSDGKTIKHTYNKGGDYIVKINHDSTANLAIPNNIKTIHNIGDITDLSYVFMFKTNLTKIDTGAFDNCKSVNNLSNCFDGCRFLNHAYNLTSQGLKKLWERDGDSDGVRIENYDMFGENTGTLFANTIPSEWGGNL